MALTNTKSTEMPVGSMRMTLGTFTEGASETSGNLYTGLTKVAFVHCTPTSAATEQVGVTTTLPAKDPIALAYTAGVDGYFMAVGW